jgi:hypothetical protein
MTNGAQKENSERADASGKPREKKPYKKPTFRYEQVFVTSALSCGKVHATQSGCMMNRKLS